MSAGYPVAIRTRAVQLVNEIGLGPRRAADVLERETGVRVFHRTIGRWADPRQAESKRRDDRDRRRLMLAGRHDGRLGYRQASPAAKVARIAGLLDAGLKPRDVARAMMFDYPGDCLDGEDVLYSVQTGRYAG